MPNIKSARKRMRTSAEAHVRNVAVKTRVKTHRRDFMEISTAAADRNAAEQAFRTYCSELDKAARHGVIKKNTAIRRKARAAARLRKLVA